LLTTLIAYTYCQYEAQQSTGRHWQQATAFAPDTSHTAAAGGGGTDAMRDPIALFAL